METVSPKIVLLALLFMTDLMCQQIDILEGDNISLKPEWKENINEITWTLEHNKVAEMNINGKVRVFKHFEGRAQLNTHTGALNISVAQIKDSGTYRCELIDNKGFILPTRIVLLVHPRLEAPQINCIHENTAVDLGCETSSSEHITYNWNFPPCTTNSDDCELKNNNEMITIRNAIRYMSLEVYCTVNNSLHSIRSESVLIRNCITDLRNRLWLVLLLFGAAISATLIIIVSHTIIQIYENLRKYLQSVMLLLAVAASAVSVVDLFLLIWRAVNLSDHLWWMLLSIAAVCAFSSIVLFISLLRSDMRHRRKATNASVVFSREKKGSTDKHINDGLTPSNQKEAESDKETNHGATECALSCSTDGHTYAGRISSFQEEENPEKVKYAEIKFHTEKKGSTEEHKYDEVISSIQKQGHQGITF